ncbi:MAG TPA: 50S ribosomal protein L25 [Chloroflexota bacterium]|nr:50S ribosomal protein L25 [Chloroflexota bacterium]HUM68507.1 50S ribosomal protein L25 [Chloroflexota bacterium]
MSEKLTIAAEPRTVIGKQVKQLRREGMIPAVIYGQREPVAIQLENKSLRRVLRQASTTHLIDLEMQTGTRTVLAREIQQHPTRGDLIHVDFMEVNMAETITSEAELVLVGETSEALKTLGTLVLLVQSVGIECLPGDLVSEIEVQAAGIDSADDVIYIADLQLPKGVTILADPETVVAHFEYNQTAEAAEAEEAALTSVESVEVVEKGKREEE